ncbi:hypothetical protein SDC9_79003 [bioreactor metagenome]|uniref:Uncharacterized protein n=1 Tax=bioreactor metagenome TaxID=1076179 RepID=A0A644YX67_9ZZZZ
MQKICLNIPKEEFYKKSLKMEEYNLFQKKILTTLAAIQDTEIQIALSKYKDGNDIEIYF